MDQPGENKASEPQSTNHSSTTSNPSLSLGAGQQASILQVGGQSFLILTAGQTPTPLQGLGLNLVPVGGPNTPLLQTGGPQEQVLQVGGVSPAIGQLGGTKPLFNQTGRVPPNVVQIRSLQPGGLQLGPGVQANELKYKLSHSISPCATKVRDDGLQSSSVQSGHTVPPQSATLQIRASKIKEESEVVANVQSFITQSAGAMPPLMQAGRAQTKTARIGGRLTSSMQVGSPVPLEMVKSKTKALPTCKKVHPAVVQTSGAMEPLGLTARVQPNVIQFGGLQTSSAQVACSVPSQTEFSQAHVKVKTEPGLEDPELQPLTIQASGRYAETTPLIGFATPTVQSSLFQPSMVHASGLQSVSPSKNAKNSALTKKNKQYLTKKGSKCPPDTAKHVDVACSALNLVKMKHASTNTTKKNKSIGTQAKISLKNKSQAVQFPENSYGDLEVPTYQECSTQSEESFWPGQVCFRQSTESHPCKVVIVRDPEPESVSLFLSESSRGGGDRSWNMEGVEKWMHEAYEVEHPHFDDVALYFTGEEWACLNEKDKRLYRKVMMDNYWNLMAVGKISVTPPVISKIERGEEPCTQSPRQSDHNQFPDSGSRGDPPSENLFGERYNIQSFHERLKSLTYPIKLAAAGLTVTRIVSDTSPFEPSPSPPAEDRPRDPGEHCPFRAYLKTKPALSEKPFRCFKCERSFKRFGNLTSHYRVHQGDDLTCDECGKKFTKIKAFLLHYMRHTGERPFVCSGCGKTFSSQVCLNNHYGSNAKKKQYECGECGKRFGLKHSLAKHQKLHRGDSRNACSVCGKEFSHKAGLRLHERVHGSHYICAQCGRYFSHKGDFERHAAEHTQVFACNQCGKAFTDESQLAEHRGGCAGSPYPDLVIKVEEED